MFNIKHLFHSSKADGTDSTLIKPTDWNADHGLTTDQTNIVLGRRTPGPGAIEELPLSTMFPVGAVTAYAGATAPTGWLLCYGQSLIQADYNALYLVIGATYGAGPGPSTFMLPDLRGAAIGGKSNMGGADRGNMPGGAVLGQYLGASSSATGSITSSGNNPINLGDVSGRSYFNQTSGTNGAGTYNVQPSAAGVMVTGYTDPVYVGGWVQTYHPSIPISVSGSSSAFNIVQPTVMLNYIIKT